MRADIVPTLLVLWAADDRRIASGSTRGVKEMPTGLGHHHR